MVGIETWGPFGLEWKAYTTPEKNTNAARSQRTRQAP